MKNCFIFPVMLACALVWQKPVFGQPSKDPELALRQDLRDYFRKVPPEQFLIHTDRSLYSSGDSIWFCLYGISYGGPTQLSGLAYLRLLDAAGRTVKEQKYLLAGGMAFGEMKLPDTLTSGDYFLQAFSFWSLSNGGNPVPLPIQVIRPFSDPKPGKKSETKTGKTLKFYHEGGNLVDSITTITALSASDEVGNPVAITGVLSDEKGNKLATLETSGAGLGLFRWIPGMGSKIRATVQFPGTTQKETVWLEDTIRSYGTVLRVRQQEAGYIEFTCATRSPARAPEKALALIWQNAGTFRVSTVSLDAQTIHYSLSTSGLKEGLARFCLLSAKGDLLGERWVYIPPSPNDSLVNFKAKAAFEQDSLVIRITSQPFFTGEKWLQGSISITDAEADLQKPLPIAAESFFQTLGIIPYPELKAFWDPAGKPDSVWLEPFLLSHPPEMPRWEDVLNSAQNQQQVKPERQVLLVGKLKDFQPNIEGKNKPAFRLMVDCTDGTLFLGNIFPDSLGRFVFPNSFRGQCSLRVEKEVRGKVLNITNEVAWLPGFTDTLSSSGFPQEFFRPKFAPPTQIAGKDLNAWAEKFGTVPTRILENITVSAAVVPPKLLPWTDYISRPYRDERATLLDFTKNRLTNTNWIPTLNGRIPGLQIQPGGSGLSFVYRGGNTNFISVESTDGGTLSSVKRPGSEADLPYFYIDEMRSSLETVQSLPVSEIALVVYYPPPVFFAPYNGGNVGAFQVYTRRENGRTPREKPVVMPYKGLELVPEFIPPQPFQNRAGGASRNPALYYWGQLQPMVNNGPWLFRIPLNSLKAKKLRITIQGLTISGKWVYWEEELDTGR